MELLIVLSDTHGRLEASERIIREWPAARRVIHLGDHLRDALELRRRFPDRTFEIVPGNCDFSVDPEEWPADRLLEIEGKRLLLTHGNRYGVKDNYDRLFRRIRQLECDLALCGHTHDPIDLSEDGRRIVNPGSAGLPRVTEGPTYALVEIGNGRIEARLMEAT